MARRISLVALALVLVQSGQVIFPQQPDTGLSPLQRRYTNGVVSNYEMTGDNDGWRYTIRALDVVKRDANGRYYEEIQWSNLTSNVSQTLTPASLAFRQSLSLDDPASYMKVPNLTNVQPLLIGPITDTLTIYSDLLLAIEANLGHSGQSAYVPRSTPNSWADGQRVLLGQDVVDFSLKVEEVNPSEHTETLFIQHVPPPGLHVQLPADWMRTASASVPANFVQVTKEQDHFIASVGKETFDVRLVVDTRDGKILSATLHNPVTLTTRECTDRELTHCGSAVPKTVLREITWKLVP
jgi:hypothetical protein